MTDVDRTQLPGLRQTTPFRPPAFRLATLENGVSVWTASHRRAPVLTLRLLIPTGAATDPAGQWGLAALTAALLDEGTAEKSDVDLHEALTRIGHSREPGTVDDEMYACARGEAAKCKVEVLTTP